MTETWIPECAEDELLVAFVAVKRGLQAHSVGADPGVFPVLHFLAVAGPSRQAAMADALGLDASTVSRHVRALVADGYVEGARDPGDGRATVLTLTGSGEQALRGRLQTHRAALQSATSHFTPGERAELVRLLSKLATALSPVKETA